MGSEMCIRDSPLSDPVSVLDASGQLGFPTILFSRFMPRRSEIVTLNHRAETQNVIEENLRSLTSDNLDQRTTWNPSGMVSLRHVALVDTATKRRSEEAQEGESIGIRQAMSELGRGGARVSGAQQDGLDSENIEDVFVGGAARELASLPELAVRTFAACMLQHKRRSPAARRIFMFV